MMDRDVDRDRPGSQLTLQLPTNDLVGVRVEISPYFTMITSILEVIRSIDRGSPAAWRRYVLERSRDLDLAPLLVFDAFLPDFISEPPTSPRASIDEELYRLRLTPPERVLVDLEDFGDDVPIHLRPFATDPQAALALLTDALEAYWNAVFKPLWPAMEALLEREVLRIGTALATDGPSALMARISHRLQLDGNVLTWRVLPDGSAAATSRDAADLDGRRLLLLPLCSGPDAIITNRSRQDFVSIAYASPGVGLLWERVESPTDDGLERLLGRTRSRVMRAVHTPATTADVALALEASPALVSHHLTALRKLELVDGTRFGRRVYYRVTTRGRDVWNAMSQ
jgi:DNA-binding transcriptional ArsR family regulator